MASSTLLTAAGNRRFDLEANVFQSYQEEHDAEDPHRWHIGASDIAHVCPRHIWYVWRWSKVRRFDKHILRRFQRGHRMESVYARDIDAAGCVIYTHDTDGEQFEYGILGNHCKVHLDGIALVPQPNGKTFCLIVEMKAMSEKRFANLEKNGLQKAHPDYYRQVQTQLMVAQEAKKHIVTPTMASSIKFRPFDGVLFFAENTNTDEIYMEQVVHDHAMQDEIRALLNQFMNSDLAAPPPLDCSTKAPPCLWCDFKSICREQRYDEIEKNCRTCAHGNPVVDASPPPSPKKDGQWKCDVGNKFGTVCHQWTMRKDF